MKMVLEGIKVIDISQVVAVPVAARHLADFGADVIHIENPKTGDSWRGYLAGMGGMSSAADIDSNWEAWNRNKKSMALDLASQRGQEIVYKLVEKADVLVTNLRIWEKEKYGLEYETLKKINPRLIYGTITGYGKQGPDKNLPAYDTTALLLRAGVVHSVTPPGVSAIGFRAGFGDTVAGMSLFAGVMTALYHRERTGVGQEVELSLFHTGIYQLSFDVSDTLVTGRDFKDPSLQPMFADEARMKRRQEILARIETAYTELRELNKEFITNPLAMAYRTKDNRIIHLNILQPDRYWGKVCQAVLGQPELEEDPRFNTQEARRLNNVVLYDMMKQAMLNRTLQEWNPILSRAQLPFAPLQTLTEVVKDPQARANDCFVTMNHPSKGKFEVIASPLNLSETPASYRFTAPEFSQHTEEILLELGYSWDDIARLKEKGVIA